MVINAGIVYFALTIYGDDVTTLGVDEGMNDGENFTLQIWDASTGIITSYPSNDNVEEFAGWTNTNEPQLPGYNDPNEIYNFIPNPPPPAPPSPLPPMVLKMSPAIQT
ncbi:MAG: hypothetical protein R2771_14260 [Saprospiraceae bacterium]